MSQESIASGSRDDELLALAFYVVVDVSWSMSGPATPTHDGSSSQTPIDAVNMILPQVVDAINESPTLGDVVRLGAMDFSDDAQVVLRLDDLRNVQTIPTFSPRGGTSYAAAFQLLRTEIERDLAQLKSDNYRVYRPAVFFITDGEPTDDAASLKAAYEQLTDPSFRARPNIIPFGVGGATKDQLDTWVFPKAPTSKPMRSYVAKDNIDAATAINKVAEILISSIIASAQSVSQDGQAGGFVPPADEDLDDEWI